jgi:hypothetical protein
VWVVRLPEEHGVDGLPLGKDDHVRLRCDARATAMVPPRIHITASVCFTLIARWPAGDAPAGGEMSAVRVVSEGESTVDCGSSVTRR